MDAPRRSIWWRWAAAMLAGLALVYPLALCFSVLAEGIVEALKPYLLTDQPRFATGSAFEDFKDAVGFKRLLHCQCANAGALMGLAGYLWKIAKSPGGLEFGHAFRLILLWYIVADLFQLANYALGQFWPWWEELGIVGSFAL